MVENRELKVIPIEKLVPLEVNVRKMTDEEFNLLCQSLEENGYVEPIQVVQYGEPPNEVYKIVNGNHRFEALRDVFGWREFPCIVVGKDWDDLKFWREVFRLNNVRGDWDKVEAGKKLWELYEKLKDRYDKEEIKRMLGFAGTRTLFDKILERATKGLPEEVRKEVKKRKEEIETIEDLSRIIHDAFRKYGRSLDFNFIVFSYGGKEHLMVKADNETWALAKFLVGECSRREIDVNEVLHALLDKERVIDILKGIGR